VDLLSVHGFRCYDNSAEREMSASACTRSIPGIRFSLKMENEKCNTKVKVDLNQWNSCHRAINDSKYNVTVDLLQFLIKTQCKMEITTF